MGKFIKSHLLTIFNLVVFCLAGCWVLFQCLGRVLAVAGCYLNQAKHVNPTTLKLLAIARSLVYVPGLAGLIYQHTRQIYRTCLENSFRSLCKGVKLPGYLFEGKEQVSALLMMAMLGMLTCEPLIQCLSSPEVLALNCDSYTFEMGFLYQLCVVLGIFLYAIQISEMANMSIELAEYRVLCSHAVKHVLLCLGTVAITIAIFSWAIAAMASELPDWRDTPRTMSILLQLSVGIMDLKELHGLHGSPVLLWNLVPFMLLVYTFFFNLLASQFCGVHQSLAADMKGYARLARGNIILKALEARTLALLLLVHHGSTKKVLRMFGEIYIYRTRVNIIYILYTVTCSICCVHREGVKRQQWRHFVSSLELERRIDFEEGDLGLAGGSP